MADDGRQGKLATRAAPTRHAIASVWFRIPLDMNILRAVKRSPLGLDLYLGLGEQWNRKYGRRLDLGPPE